VSFAKTVQHFRVPLGFLLGGLYLFFARPTPGGLVLGGIVAFVGVLIRAWAAGHNVKNDRLATTGPYAHTRNPLYFGSFLIAAGFAIAAHWALLLVVIAFFVLIYAPTMERERAHIRGKFPDAFAENERNVPAFVPRPVPWRASGVERSEPFSFALYMRHGEWRAALVFVLVALWLAFRVSRGF
jgi:protein-S-isoprenylcysteine O-methyltransferase Ste14